MQLEVLDVDKFVTVNTLQPVTAPIFFEADGSPTVGGLFSATIFGRPGSEDRRRRWAYIELGGRYLHPLIYKTLCQLDRRFPELVAGTRRVELTRTGQLRDVPEDEDGGWSGLDELYRRWDEISWGGADAGTQRAERVGLVKVVPKVRAFVTKWPVMPALFRDVEVSGDRVKEVPPINYLYVQLMTSAPTQVSGLSFSDGARKRRAQESLLEIHRATLELVSGKKGLIQDRILGKYTDWTVRGVLSGPTLSKAEHPADQEVPFGYVGVPLYLLINIFQPFVIKVLTDMFRGVAAGGQERVPFRVGDVVEYIELPPTVRGQFGPDLYKKWISRFMRSQANRLDPVAVTLPTGKELALPLFDTQLGRKTTLLDLFYIVASDIVADKHIMFTRYPVEDFRACHFTKASILTTERTEAKQIAGRSFPRYPVISEPIRWVDSFRLNNSYTKAMGADYDGDTHRVVGLFTQEANAEAAKMIAKPTNYCDGQGSFSRPVANEAVLTLFALTK